MSLAADRPSRLRWLWRSSSLRLSLLLSLVFALGMSAAIFAALGLGRDAVLSRVDGTLQALAGTMEMGDPTNLGGDVLIRELDDLRGLPPAFLAVIPMGGGTVTLDTEFRGDESWRVLVTRDADGEAILIAASLDDSLDALELLGGILWATAGLVIALTLCTGLAIGVFAQRRVRRIETTLARLAKGDLQARTGVAGAARRADDLGDIARALDSTAGALERLVVQTRHLSASLAHDLRTPLARLQAQLEGLPAGEAREAALAEAARLSAIFDTILRVARIEAAQGEDGFSEVDLGALMEEIAEIFAPVIEDAGKVLHLDLRSAATLRADRQMLIQAMANLIQNALVHGGPEVTLFASAREIGVADTGAGIPEAMRAEVVRPMVRLDAARTRDGSGLGLALVRAVAERHGAALRLTDHAPQDVARGLRVALNFT